MQLSTNENSISTKDRNGEPIVVSNGCFAEIDGTKETAVVLSVNDGATVYVQVMDGKGYKELPATSISMFQN